jgi:hypothetical protein
MSIQVPGR